MIKVLKTWETHPVEFLIFRKFPFLAAFSKSPEHLLTDAIKERLAKERAEADSFRKSLATLSQEDFKTLVDQAKDEEAEQARKYHEDEDNRRFFNQPAASANFEYWAKASYWTIDEAVALSFGKDPRKVNENSLTPHKNLSPFAMRYFERRELFQRAVATGQLSASNIPGFLLAWASRMQIEMPAELRKQVSELGVQIADWKSMFDEQGTLVEGLKERIALEKERAEQAAETSESRVAWLESELAGRDKQIAALSNEIAGFAKGSATKSAEERRRQTMLRLILGLAIIAYKYDPKAARSSVAGEVARDLAPYLSVDEDTIRKYLNEAKELFDE